MSLPHEYRLSVKPKTYVVTVSTSRYSNLIQGYEYNDPSGDLAEEILRENGIEDIERILIKDDINMIREVVDRAINSGVHMIIFIGGTGISETDVTIEALKPLFKKELTSFNTLFTIYSEAEVGSRAVSSRATAGVIDKILVFALPGSPNAVKTALRKIILKEYEHLLYITGILR